MRDRERRDRVYRDFAAALATHATHATHGGSGAGCGGHGGASWGGRHAGHSHGHVAVVVSSHVHFEGLLVEREVYT